jgi:hypothetical protein
LVCIIETEIHFMVQNATIRTRSLDIEIGTILAIPTGGGCSMRSMALAKVPGAALAVVAAAAVAQVANLSFEIPINQLQLAWTLTRVLIQL